MKFEVTITKRALLFLAGLIFVLSAVFVYATTPNPGHDASTVGDGSAGSIFGGSSTFAGGTSSVFFFPGRLSTGPSADPATAVVGGVPRDFYVKAVNTGWGGIGVETSGDSAGNSHTFLDFIHDGQIKANLDYNAYQEGDALLINSAPGAATTKVGIGTTPTTEKLEVGGRVKADGFCVGNSCDDGKYYIEATKATVGTSIPLDMNRFNSICADEDGCEISLGMKNYDPVAYQGLVSSVGQYSFFLNQTTGWWHLGTQGGAFRFGKDGVLNGGFNDLPLSAWSCYLTDTSYANEIKAATDSPNSLYLLNSNVYCMNPVDGGNCPPYTNAQMACSITVRD